MSSISSSENSLHSTSRSFKEVKKRRENHARRPEAPEAYDSRERITRQGFKNPIPDSRALATGFKNPRQGSRTLATSEPFTERVRVYAVVLAETRTQAITTQKMRTRQWNLESIHTDWDGYYSTRHAQLCLLLALPTAMPANQISS